jgi:hypothetical protein
MPSITTQILAVTAIVVSVLSLFWNVLVTVYGNYSRLKIMLVGSMGLKLTKGGFKPDSEFQLLIRNSAPRENGIIEYMYFRDGWSFEQGEKRMIGIPRWSVISLKLQVSEKRPFPAFVILEDYNECYYLIPFLHKDSGEMLSSGSVFKSKECSKIEGRLKRYNEV